MTEIKKGDLVRIRGFKGRKNPNLWTVEHNPNPNGGPHQHMDVRNIASGKLRRPKAGAWYGYTGQTRLRDLIKL
jgi:hypothetical protein